MRKEPAYSSALAFLNKQMYMLSNPTQRLNNPMDQTHFWKQVSFMCGSELMTGSLARKAQSSVSYHHVMEPHPPISSTNTKNALIFSYNDP